MRKEFEAHIRLERSPSGSHPRSEEPNFSRMASGAYGYIEIWQRYRTWQAAYRLGQERMRERAAQLADKMMNAAGKNLEQAHDDDSAVQYDTAAEVSEAIRALALEEE